jgi:hypothetical protein
MKIIWKNEKEYYMKKWKLYENYMKIIWKNEKEYYMKKCFIIDTKSDKTVGIVTQNYDEWFYCPQIKM